MTARDEVQVGPAGVVENRRFFLVDPARRAWSTASGSARCRRSSPTTRTTRASSRCASPTARVVAGAGRARRAARGALLLRGRCRRTSSTGPWSAALSELRRRAAAAARERPRRRAPSTAARAARSRSSRARRWRAWPPRAGAERPLDARRFRMLFEIDGVGAHEEDAWLGRPLRLGEAVISLGGHTGRCVVTTRDPESGVRDARHARSCSRATVSRADDRAARLRRPRRGADARQGPRRRPGRAALRAPPRQEPKRRWRSARYCSFCWCSPRTWIAM